MYRAEAARIDLFKVSDIALLINMHQYIRTKDLAYNESAELLKLDEYPVFNWLSYPFEAWDHDIKQRIAIVKYHKEQEKLQSAKDKLSDFLSKEDKLSILLKDLDLKEI